MNINQTRISIICAAAAAVTFVLASQGAVAQAQSDGGETILEEIIVTAQKREQRLQEVPISISVLSGDQLDRGTFTSINDALRDIPGIAMNNNPQTGMAKFTVRGVTSNPSIFNGSSTVGYYLDEIPFAFARFPLSPDANAYDLERVEVLRGPQGTLYGASSVNGVIRVLTEDANLDESEFKTRATLSSTDGGGENYRVDAAASIPLIPGKLAVRAVAGYSDYDGWIEQPLSGRENVNDAQQKNFRIKVNAAPTENLGVEFMAWIARDERGGYDGSFLDDQGNQYVITHVPEPIDTDFDAFNLTLSYDFSAFSLLSSTSYMNFENEGVLDDPAPEDDVFITRLYGKLASQEVRLTSRSDGLWKWSLGAIYRDGEDTSKQNFEGVLFAPFFPTFFWNVYESKSYAVFGELSRLFFDNKLEITAGLRYFEDESTSNEIDTGNLAEIPPFGIQSDTFTSVTPRVVVAYLPNENVSFYASYGEGFRSGFSQNGTVLRNSSGLAPAVEPDTFKNYEIGMKGRALGGRFTYDLAGYYMDWQDTVQVLPFPLETPAGVFCCFVGAGNSESASGFGVDAGVTMNVTDRLDLGVTASWNDLAFDADVVAGDGTVRIPEGSRLAQSPELTAGARIDYSLPLGETYSGGFHASVNHTSRLNTPSINPIAVKSDDITRVRTSFSVLSPERWSVMAYVDNLTDEDGSIRGGLAGIFPPDRLRPRTYGVQLDYSLN